MEKLLKLIFALLFVVVSVGCQQDTNTSTNKALLEEFELINLCHCQEYLMLRHYDYVAWKSEKAKIERIEQDKNIVFGQFRSTRHFSLFFQQKYDSTLFYKNGVSNVMDPTKLNFTRLDSLYYEPLVAHYVNEESKTNPVPYLGLRHNNFYFDCYYTVKQMPLNEEFKYFVKANMKAYPDIKED